MARQRERAAAGALRGVPSARHSRGRPHVAGQAPRRGAGPASQHLRARRRLGQLSRQAPRLRHPPPRASHQPYLRPAPCCGLRLGPLEASGSSHAGSPENT